MLKETNRSCRKKMFQDGKIKFQVQMKSTRKNKPTPVFLPGESQGWGSLVGFHLWGCTESDTTEVT